MEAGELWKQPELAATLACLQKNGPEEFYTGETARRIDEAMRQNGGTITRDDLQNYKPVEREPLRGSYRGFEIRDDAAAELRRNRATADARDARAIRNCAARHNAAAK